jgi:hypothetical protein
VPVPAAGDSHGDEGQDVPAAGAWRRDEQSAGGFDGHRNPVVGIVAESARHFQQFRQAGGYIFDSSRGQQMTLSAWLAESNIVTGEHDSSVRAWTYVAGLTWTARE